MFHNLLSAYLADTLEPFVKWFAIGLLIALVVFTAVYLLTKQKHKRLFNGVIKGVFFFIFALGIFLLILEIAKKFNTAYLEDNWVSLDVIYYVLLPLLVTLVVAFVGAFIYFLVQKKNAELSKKILKIFGAVFAVCVITTLILVGIHFATNIDGDGYYTGEDAKLNSAMLYISAIVIIALTLLVAFVLGRKDKSPFNSKTIAFAGITIALSFTLSYIKLWDMPTGGSVTLVSFLPIMLFAFVYGTKKGLLVGFLYGLLQAVQDPWLIHPAQFLIDYPLAFSCVCFAGVFTDLNLFNRSEPLRFALSALLAGTFRYVCHVLSGVFAFGAYAIDAGATNLFTFSVVYNSYVFVDVALVIIAGAILLSSKAFSKELGKLKK